MRITALGVLLLILAVPVCAEWALIENTASTLIPPEGEAAQEYTIAQSPATIRFSVVEGCTPFQEDNKGVWSSWSEGIVASDGLYYTAISNHCGVDGRSFVTRLDPETGEQTIVLDTDLLFDHQPGIYGHGKIHGRLDEYPAGSLYLATYWGVPPLDTKWQGDLWTGPIPGGRLVRIDLASGNSVDLGETFARDSWPMFATDTRRGIFFGIGYDKHFLAHDLKSGKTIYAALPPPNIDWFPRCTLIDESTGICYGTSRGRFVKFDPETAAFGFLDIATPPMPQKMEQGENLRAYTRRRTAEGCYICMTLDGMLFKFFPDEERIEKIGPNWGEGTYSASMALSPGDRYIYFTIDVHGEAAKEGSPIVQYDLIENRHKIIAFLYPLLNDKAKYYPGGSYAVMLNEDGSRLFITLNGSELKPDTKPESFGAPSLLVIDIPESERRE